MSDKKLTHDEMCEGVKQLLAILEKGALTTLNYQPYNEWSISPLFVVKQEIKHLEELLLKKYGDNVSEENKEQE